MLYTRILPQVAIMLAKPLELRCQEAAKLCLFKSTLHECLFPELYNM